MPRVLLEVRAQRADFEALLGNGAWPDVNPSETALLPETYWASAGPLAEFSAAPVRTDTWLPTGPEATAVMPPKLNVATYRNTEIVIDVETPDSGYLVLNDPYHPWWFAQVDGQEAEILQANVLFRAVAVPAGRHRARFTFRPLVGAWRQLAMRLR